MSSTPLSSLSDRHEARFARQVVAHLSAGTQDLPHDVGERLRAARVRAIAARKQAQPAATAVHISHNGVVTLGGWWSRLGMALPVAALLVGLITIGSLQENRRVNELAEVDSALLSDELPPAAYTDPGFAQFLQSADAHSVN